MKNRFMSYFYQAEERVNHCSLAARAGILALGLLVTFLVWLVLVQWPIQQEVSQLKYRLEKVSAGLSSSKEEMTAIIDKMTGSGQASERLDLDRQAREMEEYLSVLKGEIVPPEKMAEVLRDVLQEEGGLQLEDLQLLPVRVLVSSGLDNDEEGALLFEQDVELKLSGGYLETYGYLKLLEELGWRFFWDGIDYTVKEYPDAIAVIKLHTLGMK